jgi:glyoxylase-like metal-dependent hydrolase (beta-lactamase superfamily II)
MKQNTLRSKLFAWFAFLSITIITTFGCKQQETTGSGGYMVGNYEVFELNERSGKGSVEILIDAPDSIIAKYAPDSTFDNAVNAFLVRKEEKIWIIDTGFGLNIFTIMDSLGIDPANVNHVLLTHMHGDHIGGMLRDSTLLFPNAQVVLSREEFHYWSSLGEKDQNAQNILNMYAEKIIRLEPYDLDDKFEDGIHMIEAYGHTPGHVMFLIKDGKDQLLIWGDLVHASAIQFPHPEISVKYDVDPQTARETRQRVMKFVQENSIPVAGMHLPHSQQFTPRIN